MGVTDMTTAQTRGFTTNPTNAPTDATTTNDPPTTTIAEATTTSAQTTEKVTTEKLTTEKATTTEAATTEAATIEVTTTKAATTNTVEVENDKAIIVMLDATGSMQNIGGRGKGRDIVVRKMEQFRQMLVKKVQNDRINNQKITFITFNERAVWKTYDSIDQWPIITRENYNPGYQTNLFDTMGCVLSEFKARAADTDASVYLISDGVHALKGKKRGSEAYQEYEVKEMVEE